MSGFDFTSVLGKAVDDVVPPPRLPTGTYRWVGTKVQFPAPRSGSEWARIVFICQCVEAGDDVDPEMLAEFGDLSSAKNNVTFLFPTGENEEHGRQASEVRMLTFLRDHCGIEVSGTGIMLQEYVDAYPHSQFFGEIEWQPNEDNPEVPYVRITGTAPLS